MGSTSAFGIAFAALTAALAVSSPAAPPPEERRAQAGHSLTVKIVGLRDSRGLVRLCLAEKGDSFPNCGIKARSGSAKAQSGAIHYRFSDLHEGEYAVAAFHDANGNGKLDTTLGIPREGFAFSNNPPLRPRAPTFTESRFPFRADVSQQLKMRYIL